MTTRRAALVLAVIVALGVPAALLGPEAAARSRLVRKSYEVAIACESHDEYCQPAATQRVRTKGVLEFEFIASPSLCTPVEILFWVGSPNDAYYGPFLAEPGGSTGVVDPGRERNAHHIYVWARDAPGGCEGEITAWGGTLEVTTSKRVRR